jgi:AraC-like DNA-binding protein
MNKYYDKSNTTILNLNLNFVDFSAENPFGLDKNQIQLSNRMFFENHLTKGFINFFELDFGVSAIIIELNSNQQNVQLNFTELSKNLNTFCCVQTSTIKKSNFYCKVNYPQIIIPKFQQAQILIFQINTTQFIKPIFFTFPFEIRQYFEEIFRVKYSKIREYSNLLKLNAFIFELINEPAYFEELNTIVEEDFAKMISIENTTLLEINKNGNTHSIEYLAQKGEMSATKFKKLFKIIFKFTPHQYFQNYRMSLAKDLMLNKKSSISEIAFQLGYKSLGKFSTAFQKKFQILPSKVI